MTTATSVKVWLPVGEATFACSEMSSNAPDVLTITAHDSDFILREFQPSEWDVATVYDSQGNSLHSFTNHSRGGTQ